MSEPALSWLAPGYKHPIYDGGRTCDVDFFGPVGVDCAALAGTGVQCHPRRTRGTRGRLVAATFTDLVVADGNGAAARCRYPREAICPDRIRGTVLPGTCREEQFPTHPGRVSHHARRVPGRTRLLPAHTDVLADG